MKKTFLPATILFAILMFSAALAAGAKPVANFTYACTNPYPPGSGNSFTLDASSSTFPNGPSDTDAYTWYIRDESISNVCHMSGWHPKVMYGSSPTVSDYWCYDTPSGIFEADITIDLTVKDKTAGSSTTVSKIVHVKKACLSCLCVKETCADKGWSCGSGTENNCGKTISCGSCPSGQSCINHSCVPCTPNTCGGMGWQCGSGTENICSTSISCGACPTGYSCISHQCTPACTPQNCSGMGWECGSGTEPCGNTISCGTCSSGYTCTNHNCQCNPKTCSQMGWECGSGTEDRCTTSISCGSCPSGKTCDTATNKCVPGCVAKTCAGMGWNCGTGTETGCNTYLSCPNCTGNSECTGHQCICTPKTCNDMGWECGTGTENKCGNSLTCPVCPTGKTCNNSTHKCECLPKTCDDMGWQCGSGTETRCNTPLSCPNTCTGTQVCINHQCCTPKTCAQMGWNCGTGIETGCSTEISCGTGCTGTQVCIGNNCCSPKTCADFPGQCGNLPDGCGATINCNSNCTAGTQTCFSGICCTPKTCTSEGWECTAGPASNGCGSTFSCSCTAGTCISNKCNKAPKASFIASPGSGFAPLTVEFKSTSTDIEGDALYYWWDFNTADGIAADSQLAEVTHVYTTPGTVTVRLTVKDQYNGPIFVEKTLNATERTAISAFTATNPKNKNEITEVIIACNKDAVNVKIEYLDRDGNPITGLPPDSLQCGTTATKITKAEGFFPAAGIYLVKATITSEACSNCPKTTNIAVGTEMPPVFTPETHPIFAVLIAMAALMLVQRKSKK